MVKLVHTTLHIALKQAVQNDMISRNVTEKCVLPKHEPDKARALTPDEQQQFVKAIKGTKFEFAFLLCLYTRLRRGEVLALKWEDIDLGRGGLHVNKSVVRVTDFDAEANESKTKIMLTSTKSKSGVRFVPVPKELLPLVKQHKIVIAKAKLLAGEQTIRRQRFAVR